MTVETGGGGIASLNSTYPAGGDSPTEGDNHIRLTKAELQNEFPNFVDSDPVTATQAELNALDGITSTTAELNLNDGASTANSVASKTVVLDSNKGIKIDGASPATPAADTVYNESFVKAWVRIDGSSGTPTIIDSFNVSSLDDLGVGHWRVNFITNMANTNYAVFCTNLGVGGTASGYQPTMAVGSTEVYCSSAAGAVFDGHITVMVLGAQ